MRLTFKSLRRLKGKEGVALITTLMVIALLVAVIVEFNRMAIADIDVSQNFGDEKKILYITISGVNVIRELLKLDALYTKSDTLFEEWANSKASFDYATSMLDEGRLEGQIIDENGKIDVNSLVGEKGDFNETQKAIWERLLGQRMFALSDDQINRIIYGVKDWLDQDFEITGIYGAENSLYMAKGYACKNGPLDVLEEMLMINGVTEEIFYGDARREGIRHYFTVYGSPKININTAPIPVLMALSDNLTEDIALEMDRFRRDETNKALLGSNQWYKRVWPLEKPLPETVISTSSSAFSVYIRGELRKSVKDIHAVISRSVGEGGTALVYWQEM